MNGHAEARGERPAGTGLELLLHAPAAAYVAVLTSSVIRYGWIQFDKLDVEIFLGVVLYEILVRFSSGHARRAMRVGLVVAATALPLLLAEAALRLTLPSPPENVPWPPMHRSRPAPSNMPGVSGIIETTTNDLGVRGPMVRSLEDFDVRILTVGGSTTECQFISDRDTWPWRLGDELAKRLPLRRVFVGNAGRAGNLTLNHDYQLRNYPLAGRFQWVTLLCGINDLGTYLRDNYHERERDVAEEALTPTFRNRPSYRASMLGRMLYDAVAPHLARANQRFQDPMGRWEESLRADRRRALAAHTITEAPPGLDRALDRYRENLRHIVSITRNLNQGLVMMTQPTIYRSNLEPALDALLWQHAESTACTPALLEKLMDAYNDAMKDVCHEAGVDCVDLAAQLPKDASVFYDDCHLNIEGCRRVGDIMADYFARKIASR